MRKGVTVAKAEGTDVQFPRVPRAGNTARAGVPRAAPPPAFTSYGGMSDAFHTPEPQGQSPTPTQPWGHTVAIATHTGKPF